jgi:hypothetical protein
MSPFLRFIGVVWLLLIHRSYGEIDRERILDRFHPTRNRSKYNTPMQLGNGNFAFNADITGLQTLQPFNILSGWGWHSSKLPPGQSRITKRKESNLIELFDCAYMHRGRLRPGGKSPEESERPLEPSHAAPISLAEWEQRNPHRFNLGRIGFLWDGREIQEWEITNQTQTLNLTTGILVSSFIIYDLLVDVETLASPSMDAIAFSVKSDAMMNGSLNMFLDFPYPRDDLMFEAPYMGVYTEPGRHTTAIEKWGQRAQITHKLDETTYYVNLQWYTEHPASNFSKVNMQGHRYVLNITDNILTEMAIRFSQNPEAMIPSFVDIREESKGWWKQYWSSGAFVDCTATSDPRALELQRRTVLSQYLMAVNAAGLDPPQESGLANNGWAGKFNMEMAWWHLAHWERWSKWERIGSAIPLVYERFLPSSIQRAKDIGHKGARWSKMTDPTGKSAPGEVNSLLIWQQPHPMYFAELEYQAFPTKRTLKKWHRVLEETANFMTSFARLNESTKLYDLGPPLHIVAENTPPLETRNPTFELAYWRFGLNIAQKWFKRQNLPVPEDFKKVYDNLAPFPVADGTYIAYEGVQDMWHSSKLTSNHPSLLGIFGMLPPDPKLNLTIFQNTVANVYNTFFTDPSLPTTSPSFSVSPSTQPVSRSHLGWDFPLMAMTAARMGDSDRAINWLLHPEFAFDDVGMPSGGNKVPTPYFPGSGGLLMAVAMLADGWREIPGRKWPRSWTCEAEGFVLGI